MEALTIETFKTDKITAISVDDKNSGGSNYKSVKFAYDGGEVLPICIDNDFRLFRFRNKNSDTYSLSIFAIDMRQIMLTLSRAPGDCID